MPIEVEAQPSSDTVSGIALSFDDKYIDEWFAIRDLLKRYNAKVTFYVAWPDQITPTQWEKLSILQSDGHEIGSHSFSHQPAPAYFQLYSGAQYISNEINPSIAMFHQHGIFPTSFSYPTGAHTPETDAVLLTKFNIIRSTAGNDRGATQLETLDIFYYKFDANRVVTSAGIDTIQNTSAYQFFTAMVRARDRKEVLMIHGHNIVDTNPLDYSATTAKLEQILKYATDLGLHFYAISELHRPGDYTFDGHIDIFDYNQVLSKFGSLYTIFDYNHVVGSFGT